jgi:hypothetical protein
MNEGKIPQILYKYRSWQENELHLTDDKKYQKRILTNSEIYFTNPEDFNDPFDSTIPKRYDKLTIEEKFKLLLFHVKDRYPKYSDAEIYNNAVRIFEEGHLLNNDYLKTSIEKEVEYFCSTHGVFSVAEKPDNILMWSHYAISHRGFCIGFDSKKLWELLEANKPNPDYYYSLFPVDYSFDYPLVIPTNDFKKTFKIVLKRILTKYKSWEYENEYRYTLTGSTSQSYRIDPIIYKEIIFGCKITKRVKEDISSILYQHYPHIKRFQAKQDNESFKLNLVEEC